MTANGGNGGDGGESGPVDNNLTNGGAAAVGGDGGSLTMSFEGDVGPAEGVEAIPVQVDGRLRNLVARFLANCVRDLAQLEGGARRVRDAARAEQRERLGRRRVVEQTCGGGGRGHVRGGRGGACGPPETPRHQMSKYRANSHGCGRRRIASTSFLRL